MNYAWPGNIRELKNVVERTMILAPEGNIDSISLPEEIRESRNSTLADPPPSDSDPGGDFLVSRRELEEDYIRKVLAATGNNKTQAAKILGIHPTSLLRWVEEGAGSELDLVRRPAFIAPSHRDWQKKQWICRPT